MPFVILYPIGYIPYGWNDSRLIERIGSGQITKRKGNKMKYMQTLTEKQCNRCGHKWFPRSTDEPTICPKCKSPYWNRQRKEKKNNEVIK
jgi:predicted Zn-ribbon and HTH transcriptional regulator